MTWILPLVCSLLLGWFLADTLTSSAWTGPRWAAWLAEGGLTVLFGPGLASILYFVLVILKLGSATATLVGIAGLTLIGGAVWWKFKTAPHGLTGDPPRFPWTWILLVATALGLIFFLLGFQAASSANPNGEWDAAAIWNLRAKFLAGGPETWRSAVSPEVAHPSYPLFLTSFVALQWTASGVADANVPMAASLLFSAALLVLLGAILASRRSVALGALAWLVLLSSSVFSGLAAWQYADLLLALAMLATIILLEAASTNSDTRLLVAVGFAVGLAPWIKNEGVPFAVLTLLLVAWRFGAKGLTWTVAGAAPGLIATVVLKSIAQGREEFVPRTLGEALSKLAEPGRWIQSASGVFKGVWEAGNPWSHPLLLLALLAFALRFVSSTERNARLWLAIPVVGAAGTEFGAYLITTADLTWQIGTTIHRFLGQLWPAIIWLVLMQLRTPEEYFAPQVQKLKIKGS